MSSAFISQRIKGLYDESSRTYNDLCIIEEIKNNNTQAITNYTNLIALINNQLTSLRSQYDFNRISSSDKLSLKKILELKSKAVTRKIELEHRTEQNESYTISHSRRSDISSYSSFASAFKPRSQPTTNPQSDAFKVPSVPQTKSTSTTTNTNSYKPKISLEPKVRKSLDLPRPQTFNNVGHSRSKSPVVRRERPKSVDLTINQAAALAWDQNPRKITPPSRTLSPNRRVVSSSNIKYSSNSSQQHQARRKYEYVQPTINTQINLTPVTHSRGRSVASKSTQRREKPITVSSGTHSEHVSKESAVIKYKDKRIASVMENLQGVDREACEQILNEIMITEGHLKWDDLAGLNAAKKSLKETVVYPFLRPDLFKGLREPINGMLLFGPPGTGKTMIAKVVANESNSTFFSISASSLLSKYLGESEKLIRALFYIAKKLSPSIIFFDEIDSLLTARSDNENESSRRVKTEFLIQWSSLSSATSKEDGNEDKSRVLVLAATNLPWAIDEAARRRFTRRLYIPLPEFETRLVQLQRLMEHSHHSLSETDFILIANMTEGYSSSDITSLAKDAAMEPIRDLGENLINIVNQEIRGVALVDFESAMKTIKKSVGKETLKRFEEWASHFGSTGA